MKTWNWRAALWLTWFACLGLAGCRGETESTVVIDATQAHQTVQALVTQGMAATADGLQTPNPIASATHTALPTLPDPATNPFTATPRPSATPPSPSPTAVCDRAAAGNPIDVTIPDDTVFLPEQSFTKIWRLVNVGTCTWTRRYAVRFFYGNLMDAAEVAYLTTDVLPGQVIDIAVDMAAPKSPGVHQGNWKLQNAEGALFGIGPNGDAPFWVRIVVELPATPTATPTSTPTTPPTVTPTMTPTPPAAAAGAVTMQNGQALDLDTGDLDSGEADDLGYQLDAFGFHIFAPQSGTVMGVFGLAEPAMEACQTAGMSAAPLALESLTVGAYLCYQTDQGLYGWLRYNSLDMVQQSVEIDFRTWASP